MEMTWKCIVLSYSIAALGSAAWSGAADHRIGSCEITIAPQYAGQPLVLRNQLYPGSGSDSLYIDLFRCYISSIRLEGAGLNYEENNSYHLIDAEDSSSLTIVLKNVPVGKYRSIRFNIGIDSLTNVSGAMGGDLDPTLGMYWAWNSGYINVKLEGRSKACPTLHHAFGFHLGGYMPPCPTLRSVVLPLHQVKIRENAAESLEVNADLARFFRQIPLRTTNEVMMPSKLAAELADCFTDVFSLQ